MIGASVTITESFKRVEDAAATASFKNLGHASASIRNTAIDSIQPGDGPSAPGEPPHTHTSGVTTKGKQRKGVLPKSIAYAVDKDGAVIGPRFSVAGDVGEAFESGGEFRGQEYPARPFMLPALEANQNRFAAEWQGSIGE